MSDWICAWLTKIKRSELNTCFSLPDSESAQTLTVWAAYLCESHSPLWQVESFGNLTLSSELLPCYPRNARQGDQTGQGSSSAAVRLTPSDVLFVVLSSRSAWIHKQGPDSTFWPVKTRLTPRGVSRILHLSGHRIPRYWLTVRNREFVNRSGMNKS